jgi:beta-glucosidase
MVDASSQKRGVQVEVFKDATLAGPPVAQRIEPRFETGVAGFGTELFNALDELPTAEVLAQLGEAFAKTTALERWSTSFTPTASGAHTVFVQSWVKYRLLIDGKVVIDSSKIPAAALRQTGLTLDAKPHSVVFEQLGTQELGRPFWRVGIVHDDQFVDKAAVDLAKQADVVVLAIGFNAEIETEGLDREFRLPPGQQALIEAITTANKNTVVVLNCGGSVDIVPWIERVPALLAAWYPGQDGGTAVAQLLFGDASPSGRLPISWESHLEDNSANDNFWFNDAENPNRIVYREGVFVGYRGLQNAGIKPKFPFGFGLSYATFEYRNAQLRPQEKVSLRRASGPLFELSFDVTNSGKHAAADVPQVYISPLHSPVPRPKRELKGFARVALAPGETKHVALDLDARAFAYFNAEQNRWQADAGDYLVELGASVEDIRERLPVTLGKSISIPVLGGLKASAAQD